MPIMMDSSSDESFVWEKASSGSDEGADAETEYLKINGEEENIKVKHERGNNGEEVDDKFSKEPKAKKRKHKDEKNGYDEAESPKKKKIKTEPESDADVKKKKKKNDSMSSINGDKLHNDEYLDVRVKQEQEYLESSIDVKRTKKQLDNNLTVVDSIQENGVDNDIPQSEKKSKKKKKQSSNDISINSDNGDKLHNDEYLDMRVKQEQEYLESSIDVKHKRSKKQLDNNLTVVDSIQENGIDNDIPKSEKKSKKKKKQSSNDISINSDNDSHKIEDTNNCIEDDVQYELEPSKKSPKKKKNKESRKSKTTEDTDFEVNTSQENEDQSNLSEIREFSGHSQTEEKYSNEEDSINKSISKSQSHQSSEKQQNKSLNDETFFSVSKKVITPVSQSTPSCIEKPSKNHTGRLLDRIQFEEDSDIDKTIDSCDTSTSLKKYLKQNEHLQIVSKMLQVGAEITNNDEVWILKCPHDIDIQKLLNTEISLDGKSKIKINGETYCGILDANDSKITIMTSSKNEFIINKILPNGTIHFRKRLPKPHVQEHDVMVNNQTDFIPLPETKCRHPLFGSNYHDAINAGVRVRTRVESVHADEEVPTSHERKKKKKHKKDHRIIPKVEIDTDISVEKSPKREIESDVPVKKAKKRKHAVEVDSFKKKSKRIKLEPDSVEAWESEKAIEENLFNF